MIGLRVLVDDADLPRVAGFHWFVNDQGYVCRYGSGSQKIRLHREILGLGSWQEDKREADHISGDKLDNRRSNLRIVTHAQNGQNLRLARNNTSGYRGVCWEAWSGRWLAYAQLNGKQHRLGRFGTAEEAAAVVAVWRAENMPYSAEAA